MKILVLNCGSSSIKYALYDMTDKSVITSGGIEKIGMPDSFITIKLNGEKHKIEHPISAQLVWNTSSRFSLKETMLC